MKRKIHNQLIVLLTVLFTVSACDLVSIEMDCLFASKEYAKVEEIKPFPTFQVKKDQNITINLSNYIKVYSEYVDPECTNGKLYEVEEAYPNNVTVANPIILSATGKYGSIQITGINKGETSISFIIYTIESQHEFNFFVNVIE